MADDPLSGQNFLGSQKTPTGTVNKQVVSKESSSQPFETDRTTKVTVAIDDKQFDRISNYSYDSDILQLGDPCAVTIPDPNSQYTVNIGDKFELFMADPAVSGGEKIQKVTGLVTSTQRTTQEGGGSIITVAAADLGWHLVNDDAPIWKRLRGRTYDGLFNLLVDSTWGFKGFRTGNDGNVKLKMGGSYVRAVATTGDLDRPPILQIEPGEKPADKFIEYAKLINRLVNVSSDGWLQLFKPRYDTPVAYKFYNYKANNNSRTKNNVQRASLREDLSTRWTKSICVGTRVIPNTEGVDPNDPNAQSFRGTFSPDPRPLNFNRLVAFADPDRLNRAQATARAKWKIQRGDFDSWTYEITVFGHSQDGRFFEPDTMCEVHDEVLDIDGSYYVSAVRYNRDEASGTTTTLTIKKPNLLAA